MAVSVHHEILKSRTARRKIKAGAIIFVQMDRGLSIAYRRGPNGGRWIARWYVGDKKYRTEVVGTADDRLDPDGVQVLDFYQAQAKAREIFQRRDDVPSAVTVNDAVTAYIDFLKREKRSGRDAELRLNRLIVPALGARTVASLTLQDLEAWRNGLIPQAIDDPERLRRSKDTANRVLNYLKAAFNRAARDPACDITDDRAWRLLRPFPKVGSSRQLFLSEKQILTLLEKSSGSFKVLLTAAFLTGARYGELCALKVKDFDGEALHVRHGKTGSRYIFLTEEAVQFFGGLAKARGSDEPLLAREGSLPWKSSEQIRPMAAAVKAAQLPSETCLYSLRHAHASLALRNGANIQLLAENLGTSVAMIEKHYGKFTKADRIKMVQQAGPSLSSSKGQTTLQRVA